MTSYKTGGLSSAQVGGLISLMLVSGVANSILNKLQDMQCVGDCDTARPRHYEQPVIQTATMFVGETFCLVALLALRQRTRYIQSKRGDANRKQRARGGYAKVPVVDDSGVVLGSESANANESMWGGGFDESRITLRGVDDRMREQYEDELEEEERERQHQWGQPAYRIGGGGGGTEAASSPSATQVPAVAAHKAVVGPDELVPGEIEPVEDKNEQLEGTKTLLMWLPALFDICGTTLMNVGLLFVPVSVYQMLRGALVLWVGLFSVLFLGRKLPLEQWLSLAIVMSGVAVVGLSNSLQHAEDGGMDHGGKQVDVGKAVMGACLVLFAQVFTASQFVIEEKIMTRYQLEPLRAVGLEGAFGLMTTLALMPILYALFGRTGSSSSSAFFDIPTGFTETFSSPAIWGTGIAICFSIAFFNFSGLAVTKNVSATARSLIDTSRTVGIWVVSLLLGWEQLAGLQVLGFAMLVYGTLCFNGIVPFPAPASWFRSGIELRESSTGKKEDTAVPVPNYGGSESSDSGIAARDGGALGGGDRDALAAPEDERVARTSGDSTERSPLIQQRTPSPTW